VNILSVVSFLNIFLKFNQLLLNLNLFNNNNLVDGVTLRSGLISDEWLIRINV